MISLIGGSLPSRSLMTTRGCFPLTSLAFTLGESTEHLTAVFTGYTASTGPVEALACSLSAYDVFVGIIVAPVAAMAVIVASTAFVAAIDASDHAAAASASASTARIRSRCHASSLSVTVVRSVTISARCYSAIIAR
ncbi:hypothetical protein ACJJTC_013778 [Scirpophaga incertulas]